jgi:hypothetical protein
MRFTTAIAIVAALPIATVLIASQRSKPVSSATSPPPVIETPAPVAPTPPPKAANAAEIGDRVVLRYPASTIMCSLENDATGIALAGKIALGQTIPQVHRCGPSSLVREAFLRARPVRRAAAALRQVGADEARRHGVHGDAVLAQLQGKAPRAMHDCQIKFR